MDITQILEFLNYNLDDENKHSNKQNLLCYEFIINNISYLCCDVNNYNIFINTLQKLCDNIDNETTNNNIHKQLLTIANDIIVKGITNNTINSNNKIIIDKNNKIIQGKQLIRTSYKFYLTYFFNIIKLPHQEETIAEDENMYIINLFKSEKILYNKIKKENSNLNREFKCYYKIFKKLQNKNSDYETLLNELVINAKF